MRWVVMGGTDDGACIIFIVQPCKFCRHIPGIDGCEIFLETLFFDECINTLAGPGVERILEAA